MEIANIAIRPATPGDLSNLNALAVAAYRTLAAADYAPAVLEQAIRSVQRATPAAIASGTFFVAECAGQIVGCGGWGRAGEGGALNQRYPTPPSGELRQIAVRPETAGAGVASRLVLHAEAVARQAGIDQFDCVSTLTAEGFYARLGYAHVRFRSLRVGGHAFPVALMRKRLSRTGSRLSRGD